MDQIALIERDHGRAVIDRDMARLTEEQAATVRATISASWMDVHTVAAFKNAVAHELGVDPLDFQRDIVRRALGDTINKMWRVLLQSLWDSAIVKRTPILYSKAFERGELKLEQIGKGEATFVLSGWPDMPEYDCIGLGAGMEALLEYSGRRGAVVRWERQAPLLRFRARWDG